MEEALRIGKQTGSFSGAMRNNLVRILDHIKMNQWLGVDSCSTLFGTGGQHNHLLHSASILQYPVFKDSKNYNGAPKIKNSRLLRDQLSHCTDVLRQVPDAIIVPLGPKVVEGLDLLVQEDVIEEKRILNGLPHPSGANSERIKYFLGEKERRALSNMVNPDTIDKAKVGIMQKINSLLA